MNVIHRIFCICALSIVVSFPKVNSFPVNSDQSESGTEICNYADVFCERKLLRDILEEYDKDARPAKKASDPVAVNIDMLMLNIQSIDEKKHMLESTGWMEMNWVDPQLTWTPSDYHDIKSISIPISKIWKPDVIVYNYAENTYSNVMDTNAVINYQGNITYFPSHSSFKTYCHLDLKRFPFDTQTCNIVLGSWSQDITKLNITQKRETPLFKPFGRFEWKLLSLEAKRNELQYGADNSFRIFPTLQYTLKLQRISAYYIGMFVGPTVLLSVLNLLVYLVPHDSKQRMSLAMGVLLSGTLFILLLDEHLPTEAAEIPAIGRYIGFILFMNMLSIMISIMTLNFYYRGLEKGKVPTFLRQVCLGKLSKLLCLSAETYGPIPQRDPLNNIIQDGSAPTSDLFSIGEQEMSSPTGVTPKESLERTLEDIRKYLFILASKDQMPATQPLSTHKQIVMNEWRHLSLVLDRMMFLISFCLTVVMSMAIYSH